MFLEDGDSRGNWGRWKQLKRSLRLSRKDIPASEFLSGRDAPMVTSRELTEAAKAPQVCVRNETQTKSYHHGQVR